jgi:hypothetical protein
MRKKIFLYLCILTVCVCDAQIKTIIPSYNPWIDKDSCWLFHSFREISMADGDTMNISKQYEVCLPKSIIWYAGLSSKSLFVFKDNQSISIETVYFRNVRPHDIDTTYIPSSKEIYDIISMFYSDGRDFHVYRKIYKIAEIRDKTINKHRKDSVIFKDGCRILLFNIKEKDFDRIVKMLQFSFKIML